MISERLGDRGWVRHDTHQRIFLDGKDSIDYSDGQVEDYIYDTLSQAPAGQVAKYKYLEDKIKDWPSKYHFSWERQNILKPIPFGKDDLVLELGAGTGSITDYLTQVAGRVVSIEGTLSRARSISARCKGADNLDIIVGDFLRMGLPRLFEGIKFDKILFIGVLEYTPKYADADVEDPVGELLRMCKGLLKEDGEIIIAIENKLGLKYLLGWDEDHLGQKYYGVQSLYKKKGDVITYSKKEITQKLLGIGFGKIGFCYPFPDYKLPSLVIEEGAETTTPDSLSLIESLIYGMEVMDYSNREGAPDIDFGRVLRNFLYEGGLGMVSNSFLVRASKGAELHGGLDSIHYYSVSRRHEYANSIVFSRKGNGLVARKEWYAGGESSTAGKPILLRKQGVESSPCVAGRSLHILLDQHYHDGDKGAYLQAFKEWLAYLENTLEEGRTNSFDLTPYNTLVNGGGYAFIDTDEWELEKALNANQLVHRYFKRNDRCLRWLVGMGDNEKVSQLLDKLFVMLNLLPYKAADREYINTLHDHIRQRIGRKGYAPPPPKLSKRMLAIPKKAVRKILRK